MSKDAPPTLPRPVLYFDGACPVCAKEIGLYRRQTGAEGIEWVDAASCGPEALGPGLSRAEALARLHLRRPDGSLVSGSRAFVGLWSALPRWSFLATLLGSRPALWALEQAYRIFLTARQAWRKPPRRSA